ncbi:Rne/Rng family ribonuclease [Bacillus sp. 3H-10]|uniref:Rne/Rng family ribonuclease n=1 Tax=Bacillus aquiflavi TaxID=2672567 RepID=A0A6B3W0R8_9BACI|nr:Rne/Rng family ribonuclease [Bacillus aquiflavi]
MKIVVNTVTREKRFAILKNNLIEKVVIHQPKLQSKVGNIYLGIVTKILPGMNAAFVDIGEDIKGFLHRNKLPSYLLSEEDAEIKQKRPISAFTHQGEKLLVQVEKDATGTKGPRLTGIIEFQGEKLIYLPNGRYVAVSKKMNNDGTRENWRKIGYNIKADQEGLIFRTACQIGPKDDVIIELNKLRQSYQELKKQAEKHKKPSLLLENDTFFEQLLTELNQVETAEVIVDHHQVKKKLEEVLFNRKNLTITLYSGKENIFTAEKLDNEVEKALKRIVWLNNGAYLVFDEAEALTIIDVNTGKYLGKNDLRETILHTNIAAVKEIARQLRLRDIGGIILIDLIDMPNEEDRHKIIKQMEQELSKDHKRTNIIGFTPLGILQLTRKKTKISLSEALTTKCPVCHGTGRVFSSETIAFQLERELWEHRFIDHEAVLIEASKDVVAEFTGENLIYLQRLEKLLGFALCFSISQSNKPFFEIRQFGLKKDLKLKADL